VIDWIFTLVANEENTSAQGTKTTYPAETFEGEAATVGPTR
jgi:hypothetical protein